jgi:D-tyrosyl-tRNA(Tyr) deacylase
VSIDGSITSSINSGLLILLGIQNGDNQDDIKYISNKILKMRIFNDNQQQMNLAVGDVDGGIMVVSQFTLCGDVKKGNRPSYINAMDVDSAKGVYNSFIDYISVCYSKVESGTFQANMKVNLINDGPVTLILRSKD